MSGAGNVTSWVPLVRAQRCDAYLPIFSRCICDVYSAEVSENDEPQPWLRLMLHLMYVQTLQCSKHASRMRLGHHHEVLYQVEIRKGRIISM